MESRRQDEAPDGDALVGDVGEAHFAGTEAAPPNPGRTVPKPSRLPAPMNQGFKGENAGVQACLLLRVE